MGNTLAWEHTVTSGSDRLLAVGLSFRRTLSDSSITVTYAGVPLTLAAAAISTDPSTKYRAELWYLANPAVGTDSVRVSFSSGSGGVEAVAAGGMNFAGVDQATPFGATATGGGASSTPSTVTVLSASGQLVVDVLAIKGNNLQVLSPGPGQAEVWQQETGNNTNTDVIGASSTEPGGASVSMTWNVSSVEQWAQVAASLLPAPTVDLPPAADAGGPYALAEGDSLALDASLSSDPEAGPLTYSWDLDADGLFDDATGVGPVLTWAELQAAGIDDDSTYAASVRVFDGVNADTAAATVTVANTAPAIRVTGSGAAITGTPYTVTLGATDPGADTVTEWIINWGDGVVDTLAGNPPTAAHTYATSAFRSLHASVQDEDGRWTASRLLVASDLSGTENVFRFGGLTGTPEGTFGTSGGVLNRSYGTAVALDGSILVTGYDSNNIVRYDSTGAYLGVFASGLSGPTAMTYGPDRNLYVSNFNAGQIVRLDGTTGAFLGVFSSGGQLNGPRGLAFGPDGDLYAANWTNGRLVRIDGTAGGTPAVIATGLTSPDQIAFDGSGNLYITTGPGNDIEVWDGASRSQYLSLLASPIGLAFGPDGRMYISTAGPDEILVYDGTTESVLVAAGSGGLTNPAHLMFTPDHRVLVSTSNALPTANAGGPYAIAEGDSLTLDGLGSMDADGDSLTYAWDLDGDGGFGDATEGAPEFSWAELQAFGIDDDSTYTVSLIVDDGVSGADTSAALVTVANTPPSLTATGPATVTLGSPFVLTLGSSDPGDDTITSWTISWGDGAVDSLAGNPTGASHTYTTARFTRAIRVTATDEDGQTTPGDVFLGSGGTDSFFRFAADDGAPGAPFPGNGLLNPFGLTYGPDSLLYAAGLGSHDIHRYDPVTGAHLGAFVTPGLGGLSAPTRMVFGPRNDLYVLSRDTDAVLRYDGATGAFRGDFVVSGAGGLARPGGITFGPDAELYVSSDQDGRVRRYDGITGAFDGVFTAVGDSGSTDLAFGPDSLLHVSNAVTNSVVRFDGATGALIDTLVTPGAGGVAGASGIRFGPDGQIWLVGSGSDNVLRYDRTTGAFLGERIAPAGQSQPAALDFTAAHQVAVLDTLQIADLAVAKTVDTPGPAPGDTVRFTVTLSNAGPDSTGGVQVTDLLPSGLTYVADSVTVGAYVDSTGLWSLGTVLAGDSASLYLDASVDAGTAGMTLTNVASVTAQSAMDPASGNNADSAQVTVASPTGILLSGSQTARGVLPGTTDVPLLSLTVANGTAQAHTLNQLRLTNITSGTGTGPQLDAEFGTLTLWADDGDLVPNPSGDTQLGTAAMVGGEVLFSGLSHSAPAFSVGMIHVTTDVSLAAADTDILDVSIGASTDVTFSPPATYQNTFPVSPAGGLTVNGMSAAQVAVSALGGRGVGTGETSVPVMSALLPADGYRADQLSAFRVRNLGTALAAVDIAALSLWADGGDALFDAGAGDDVLLGPMAWSGVVWQATGLTHPVSPAGARVFVAADFASGATPGRTLQVEIPRNTGIAMASANDGPRDAAVTAPDTFTVIVPQPVVVSASAQTGNTLLPGDDPEEVLRVKLVNTGAAAETLQAVTFTNTTSGPGSPAQLDAEWQPLELVIGGGPSIGVGGRLPAASFSGGMVTFPGLAHEIAAGDSVELRVRSGASLVARDGDALDIALADSTGIVFSRAVTLQATFPVAPAGAFPVDGMSAAQLPVNSAKIPTSLLTGSTRNLSLNVVLPSNGYEADTLLALNVRNDGTALPAADLTRIELWRDGDGDGLFEPAGDDSAAWLGELVDTGIRWEITGLSLPVPPGGVRVFLSCDVSGAATVGSTFRPLLTAVSPHYGFVMRSGNDGPLDAEVGNPVSQTITTFDRISLSDVAIAPGSAAPGTTNVPLLRFSAGNGYTVAKTLTGLTVTNRTTGPGAPTIAERDAEAGLLRLRADSLGAAPVAQAIFSGGRATFSGVSLDLQPGEVRDFLVTADIPLHVAADGDVIAAELAGALDLTYSDATTTVGSWPIDSGAAWTVDGMLAAQLTNHGGPNATLGPSEGPVLTMDLTIPGNGYRDDILRGVSLVNLGTAMSSDFSLTLSRDGGDGVFTPGAGDDTPLGAMSFFSGRWSSTLLADALPAGGNRYFVAASTAASVTDSARVLLAVPVDGITVESGNDGPRDLAVANPEEILLSTSALLASLDLAPDATTIGGTVTATMSVRNVGAADIDGITPSALTADVPGILGLLSGPAPATLDLAAGAESSFVWTFQADTSGVVRLTGSATGLEAGSGLTRQSPDARSDRHEVFAQAVELQISAVESMPFSVSRGQTGVVPLSLTLANNAGPDGSDIRIRGLNLHLVDGSGAGVVPADLLSRVRVNEGTSVYLDKASLETTGQEVDLTFSVPAIVPTEGQVTLSLSLDIADSATVPTFRIQIRDDPGGWLVAEDATNGAPVTAVLAPGESYPIQSGLARVVSEPVRLDVSALAGSAQTIGVGQDDVMLLGVSLVNPDPDSLAADVRLSALEVTLVDSAAVAIPQPSLWLERIRVETPLQVLADRAVTALDDTTIALSLSPLISIPANTPAALGIEADFAAGSGVGTVSLRLADPGGFDARSANTGSAVPVVFAAPPVQGAPVTVQFPADSVHVSGVPLLPASLPVAATDQPVLRIVWTHPGGAETAPVRLDSLGVSTRDGFQAVAPGPYVDRAAVLRGGAEVGVITAAPATGDRFVVPLAGVTLAPGETDTLELRFDSEATSPATIFEMHVGVSGIHVVDANTGAPVAVRPDSGTVLPLVSGRTQIVAPARELAVGFSESMPAVLVADGSSVSFASVTLRSTASGNAGDLRVSGLSVRAADADRQPLDIGAAVQRVEAWVDGAVWASLDVGEADAVAALSGPERSLAPGETATVELRAVLRTGEALPSLRLGLEAADLAVVQPESPLLSVSVTAEPGQAFPFWTQPATGTASTLEDSWSNFPNPFPAGRADTRFVFFLPAPGRVTLKLYTARGEAVRTLFDAQPRGAGLHQDAAWDGRNGAGAAVTNGVYLAMIQVDFDAGGSERYLRKVAVVR